MDTVLQILLFGGLMFLMMRFGCGAHMFGRGRGHGKDPEAGERGGSCGNAAGGKADKKADENALLRWTPPEMDVDPICGETIPTYGAKSSLHDGLVFYFCSHDCREKFEADPGRYPAAGTAS